MCVIFIKSRKSGKTPVSSELELLKATSMASLQWHDTVLVETEEVLPSSKTMFSLQVYIRDDFN